MSSVVTESLPAHPLMLDTVVPADNAAKDIFHKAYEHFSFMRYALWQKNCYTFERPLVQPLDPRPLVRDLYTGELRSMIMMSNNDYLGLRNDPRLAEAAIATIKKYGVGTTGAPILSGTFDLQLELEDRLAKLLGCEAATLFTSGYAANLGTISCLGGENEAIVNDTNNHASLIDGSRLSQATFRTFRHNNVQHLEKVLQECQAEYEGTLVVVDSVFSLEGDIAPVPQLLEVVRKYGARLLLDDAHSLGVLGERGYGTCEHFGLKGQQVDLIMGVLSKAIGVAGAFVAGPREVIHYLRLNARSRVFSQGITPPHVGAIMAALDILESEPERLTALRQNVNYMQTELRRLGFDIGANPQSGIIPVMLGSERKAWPFGKLLHDQGIFCNVFAYPAVAAGKARIRLSIQATHTQQDLDQTLYAIQSAARQLVDFSI